MSKITKTRYLTIATVMVSMTFAGWALAQRTDPSAPDQSRPAERWAGQLSQPLLDQIAADSMVQMNKGQIELANFALKHTQNENVRRFAQTSIENCTRLNSQLQRFVGEANPVQPGNPLDEAANPRSETAPTPPTEKVAKESPAKHDTETAGGPGASNWKAFTFDVIRHDISNQVVASIERELAQYQGNDFDRAFVGQQFWGHVMFVASAKAGEKHVSKELRQVVDQGTKSAENQLDECRKLIRDLSSNVAARNPETTPRR